MAKQADSSAPRLQYATYRDFNRALNGLYKRGGAFQKAADRIYGAVGRMQAGENPFVGLATTNYGESRIKHCIKYDLTGFCRLITVQLDHVCVLVFCGTHEECDRWLDQHRGWQPVVGPDLVVTETYVSEDDGPRIGGPSGHSLDPLYKRLPNDLLDRLIAGLPRSQARRLESLDTSVTEGELWQIVSEIDDSDLRIAMHDVFALLRQDKVREAVQRTLLFFGDAQPLSEFGPSDLPEVIDGDTIRLIPAGSPAYAEALKRFIKTSRYRDWMLFMHPEQEAIVDEDFAGPAKLVGVSGSGKTCVAIQRAVRLARKYPAERILVLTINKALAALISQLVGEVASKEERARIDVRPFFALCRQLVLEFEPRGERVYVEVTWKIKEHVDEIWQEFYRCEVNNYDARTFQPVHDSLLPRRLNPEQYLREEIDWLRSALKPEERDRYLDMPRPGRSVALPRHFREMILEGLRGWDDKMGSVGVVDGLGIAQALMRHLAKIKARYRCVLVDEAQDFGNIELEIVRRLVDEQENDVFLCGDAAQAVTTKYQSLRTAGMDVPGARSRKLSLNYRNSRDVLQAAYAVLMKNLTEHLADREDFEIHDPEFSSFSASSPLLLSAETLDEEMAHALRFATDTLSDRENGKACIAICGYSLFELTKFGEKIRVPVLDGSTDIDDGKIFLSDLEQTKGFEFDTVCVLNCAAGVLPSATAPDDERFRDLARLYVAMTRAKTQLVLSWSREPSPFLDGVEGSFLEGKWNEYNTGAVGSVGAPRHLEAHRKYGTHKKPWREMSGEQFLYTDLAVGLSPELIDKIRTLVDGQGMIRNRLRERWIAMGTAVDDFAGVPRAKVVWGPEVGRQFFELAERLKQAAAL